MNNDFKDIPTEEKTNKYAMPKGYTALHMANELAKLHSIDLHTAKRIYTVKDFAEIMALENRNFQNNKPDK